MDNVNDTTQKKRGRPATGSKSEQEYRVSVANAEANNLPQYGGKPTSSTMELLQDAISRIDVPPVNLFDFESVKQRTIEYLAHCQNTNRRPAIAAYALYLGIQRTTLNNYVYGRSNAIDERSLAMVKYVYSLVDASYERQMTDGDMNVVAGIFLMRNNLGYTNVDTVEIVPKTQDNNSLDINDVIAEYDREDK